MNYTNIKEADTVKLSIISNLKENQTAKSIVFPSNDSNIMSRPMVYLSASEFRPIITIADLTTDAVFVTLPEVCGLGDACGYVSRPEVCGILSDCGYIYRSDVCGIFEEQCKLTAGEIIEKGEACGYLHPTELPVISEITDIFLTEWLSPDINVVNRPGTTTRVDIREEADTEFVNFDPCSLADAPNGCGKESSSIDICAVINAAIVEGIPDVRLPLCWDALQAKGVKYGFLTSDALFPVENTNPIISEIYGRLQSCLINISQPLPCSELIFTCHDMLSDTVYQYTSEMHFEKHLWTNLTEQYTSRVRTVWDTRDAWHYSTICEEISNLCTFSLINNDDNPFNNFKTTYHTITAESYITERYKSWECDTTGAIPVTNICSEYIVPIVRTDQFDPSIPRPFPCSTVNTVLNSDISYAVSTDFYNNVVKSGTYISEISSASTALLMAGISDFLHCISLFPSFTFSMDCNALAEFGASCAGFEISDI